jgi:ABC-2 type transport system permease protein
VAGWRFHSCFRFSRVSFIHSTLPDALKIISYLIPPSYVFESMRTIIVSGMFPENLFLYLLTGSSLAVIYLIGTCFFFVRIYHSNLRSGNIARFNAESL